MSAPADKTFSSGTPCVAGSEVFSPEATPPTPPFVPPTPGATDPSAPFPHPFGDYALQPDQALAMGLEVNQFLNRLAMSMKAMGEDLLVYRQKVFGQTCACVDGEASQASDGCRICFGTRFVGGYDLIGHTVGYIGSSAMARKLTEMGMTIEQKPVLYLLPDMVIKTRDFVLAKARTPVTDAIRFQAEPVVRGALDANIDPLSKLNARKIIKISLTPDGSVLPNPGPDMDPTGNYDPSAKNGGGIDFVDGVDFILTGGELTVEDALTAPPNADTRILRVLGKRAPIYPPDGETPTGEVDPVTVFYASAGLSAGLAASVFNRVAQPQAFSVTLASGAGADAGFLLVTIAGATGSNLSNQTTYPADGFLVTVVGSGVLWLGTNRPTMSSVYYVSYDAAINVTRRYQIQSVTSNHFQGVAISNEAAIELMDQTHPIYSIVSTYDLGAPLDRQVGDVDVIRKSFGQKSGLVTAPANNADPRFANPGDFL